jgi:hypothetical protein
MLIKVKVFPGSKEEQIIEKSKDSFEIRVKEKPQMGLANKAVISLVSYYFEISIKNVRIIKGFRERNKILEVKI